MRYLFKLLIIIGFTLITVGCDEISDSNSREEILELNALLEEQQKLIEEYEGLIELETFENGDLTGIIDSQRLLLDLYIQRIDNLENSMLEENENSGPYSPGIYYGYSDSLTQFITVVTVNSYGNIESIFFDRLFNDTQTNNLLDINIRDFHVEIINRIKSINLRYNENSGGLSFTDIDENPLTVGVSENGHLIINNEGFETFTAEYISSKSILEVNFYDYQIDLFLKENGWELEEVIYKDGQSQIYGSYYTHLCEKQNDFDCGNKIITEWNEISLRAANFITDINSIPSEEELIQYLSNNALEFSVLNSNIDLLLDSLQNALNKAN